MKSDHFTNTTSVIHKVKQYGFGCLSDAELLSLFVTKQGHETAHDNAQNLLREQNGLYFILASDPQSDVVIDGLSAKQLLQLQATRELALRATRHELQRGDVLSSPQKVREYLSLQLSGLQDELFCVLYLDNRHRVIEFREMSKGTIDGAAVYPRSVVKQALVCNAAAILCVHQHPSGIADPSDADVNITRKLQDALALIDVRVLDHLVIGQGVITSMAERGLM